MKNRHLIIFAIVVVLIQMTVLHIFNISSVVPNLTLVMVVVSTLVLDEVSAVKYAVFSGALLDILIGRGLGVNILAFMLLAYFICKTTGSSLFKDSVATPVLLISGSTVFLFMFLAFMNYFSVGHLKPLFWSIKVILIQIILNNIIGVPIYVFAISRRYRKRY